MSEPSGGPGGVTPGGQKTEPDADNRTLLTLARAARARAGTSEAAAVRDETGRTYVAASVSLPSLRLTALQAAVAAAVSSGARGIEAAAVVTSDAPEAVGVGVVRDLSDSAPVLVADPGGVVRAIL